MYTRLFIVICIDYDVIVRFGLVVTSGVHARHHWVFGNN